jgi:hypothetical protein
LCPEHVSPEDAIVHEWRSLLGLAIRRRVDPLRELVSPDRFRIGLGQFHTALETCGAVVTHAHPEIRPDSQFIDENIVVGNDDECAIIVHVFQARREASCPVEGPFILHEKIRTPGGEIRRSQRTPAALLDNANLDSW